MISISSAAGVGYYCGGGGGGAANYYLGATAHGEPPGRWRGRLAADLGLRGEVSAEAMRGLYESFTAPDGTKLGRAPGAYRPVDARLAEALAAEPGALPERAAEIRRQVEATGRDALLGVDLTFSPPKSVTVIHTASWRAELEAEAAGDTEAAAAHRQVREQIEAAIWAANDAALEYASTVATSRAGTHGRGKAGYWVAAPDLVVASFHQHTTRPNRKDGAAASIDPAQHIHNVVLNRSRNPDGEVRALDTRDLGVQRIGISAVADRVLAEELGRIGLVMETRPDGMAREVRGVEQDVLDLFSSRRQAITASIAPHVAAAEDRLGRPLTDGELSHIRRNAALFTRAAKTDDEGASARLLDEWQTRSQETLGRGLVPLAERVRAQVEDADTRTVDPVEFSPAAVRAVAVDAVQRAAGRSGTWSEAALMAEVAMALPVMPGLTPEQSTRLVTETTRAAIADAAVQVAGQDSLPALPGPGLGFTRPSDRRYASPDTIAGEQRIRDAALTRGRYALDREAVAAYLEESHPTLSAEQRAAAVGLAASDAALSVLSAAAGTGKSYTAGALASAWSALSEGGRVHGLAVSQVAADVLRDDGLTDTANVTAFLAAQARIAEGRGLPGDRPIGPRDVLLVDEASMVESGDLDRVRELAEAAGARLVLSGDARQLGAVGAGGVLDLVAGHAATFTLSDVRRFNDDWEAQASLRLRDGDAAALADYDTHGRLLGHASRDEAVRAAARAAAGDILAGRSTLAMAASNATAAALAAQIREHLVAAGVVVDGPGVVLGRDQNSAAVGDVVMARRNDHSLGVTNRETYTVAEVFPDGGVRVADRGGVEVVIPAGYVAADLQLGYAATVHAGQGVTVDRAHYLADGPSDPAGLYVGMTRGRERNTAHVALSVPSEGLDAATPGGRVQVEDPHARESAFAVLAGVLEVDTPEPSALVAAERDDATQHGMPHLLGRLESVTELACRDRMDRHLDALAAEGVLSVEDRARLGADQASAHLARALRIVEQGGHDPQEALRAIVTGRSLDDASSAAQVLSHRLAATYDLSVTAARSTEPGDIGAEYRAHLDAVRERVADRERALGTEVVETAPDWATRTLGPVPADPVERLTWQDNAGRVAALREGLDWTDARRPIPEAPGQTHTERRAAWARSWEALGRPESTRDEAGMTDARLRSRVKAWDVEASWAPPHADAALKAAEIDGADARTEEAHARALGDGEAATVQQEAAEQREAVARGMAEVADARSEWAAQTVETRAAAERARAELAERGINPAREDDATTSQEWAAADAAARVEDDRHREVTDVDLVDEVAGEVRDLAQGPDDLSPTVDIDPGPAAEPVADRGSPAHEVAPTNPSVVEVEALAERARQAQQEAADRESEEAAHLAWEQQREEPDPVQYSEPEPVLERT